MHACVLIFPSSQTTVSSSYKAPCNSSSVIHHPLAMPVCFLIYLFLLSYFLGLNRVQHSSSQQREPGEPCSSSFIWDLQPQACSLGILLHTFLIFTTFGGHSSYSLIWDYRFLLVFVSLFLALLFWVDNFLEERTKLSLLCCLKFKNHSDFLPPYVYNFPWERRVYIAVTFLFDAFVTLPKQILFLQFTWMTHWRCHLPCELTTQ